jgi:hypothetical protein
MTILRDYLAKIIFKVNLKEKSARRNCEPKSHQLIHIAQETHREKNHNELFKLSGDGLLRPIAA